MITWLAKHAVCTIPCREVVGDVPVFVDEELQCPLPRSVMCSVWLEPRLEGVMTYPIEDTLC